jgi:hypothetical protein
MNADLLVLIMYTYAGPSVAQYSKHICMSVSWSYITHIWRGACWCLVPALNVGSMNMDHWWKDNRGRKLKYSSLKNLSLSLS